MAARVQSGREAVLKRAVMRWLSVNVPDAEVRKRHGSVYTKAGDPDIYFLLAGRHVECELKRMGESPTPLQLSRLDAWRRAGALTVVVHSLTELQDQMAAWRRQGEFRMARPASYLPPEG